MIERFWYRTKAFLNPDLTNPIDKKGNFSNSVIRADAILKETVAYKLFVFLMQNHLENSYSVARH